MSVYKTTLGIAEHFVYQDTEDYAFSQDSVLLANFVSAAKNDLILDLGTGSGIIAMLIALKKNVDKVVGIELKPNACELARQSVLENDLDDRIQILNLDVRETESVLGFEKFDKAVCNPPYYKQPSTDKQTARRQELLINAETDRGISRTEVNATLKDFIAAAKRNLKFGGEFYIIYKHERIADLIYQLRCHCLEPKHIVYIYPKPNCGCDTVIVKAKKGGKAGLTSQIFTVTDINGKYSKEYEELYNNG